MQRREGAMKTWYIFVVFLIDLLLVLVPSAQASSSLFPLRGLNNGHFYSLGNFHYIPPSKKKRDIDLSSSHKKQTSIGNRCRIVLKKITSGDVQPGPRYIHQLLYLITALDAMQCLIHNDYHGFLQMTPPAIKQNIYSKLFYFARLRPRLLYAVGALLRALQVCTPLRRILDPSIGVGAGINLCAMSAGSRWVKPLIFGWATTKLFWTWLGGRPIGRAYVPITLSIREWEERPDPKKRSEDDDD